MVTMERTSISASILMAIMNDGLTVKSVRFNPSINEIEIDAPNTTLIDKRTNKIMKEHGFVKVDVSSNNKWNAEFVYNIYPACRDTELPINTFSTKNEAYKEIQNLSWINGLPKTEWVAVQEPRYKVIS